MRDHEVTEIIRRAVRKELMFYRHYWGQVLSTSDRLQLGRIQVSIPELRWNDQSSAPWCYPRFTPGLSVPAQNAWVEVYFVEGNPKRPVWLGRVPELNEKLKNYSSPTSHVIFEDPQAKVAILYDAAGNLLKIGSGTFAASARKGDATKIDLVTDPANAPLVMAGLAMLGMPITYPLLGAINAGSAQVQVGS